MPNSIFNRLAIINKYILNNQWEMSFQIVFVEIYTFLLKYECSILKFIFLVFEFIGIDPKHNDERKIITQKSYYYRNCMRTLF